MFGIGRHKVLAIEDLTPLDEALVETFVTEVATDGPVLPTVYGALDVAEKLTYKGYDIKRPWRVHARQQAGEKFITDVSDLTLDVIAGLASESRRADTFDFVTTLGRAVVDGLFEAAADNRGAALLHDEREASRYVSATIHDVNLHPLGAAQHDLVFVSERTGIDAHGVTRAMVDRLAPLTTSCITGEELAEYVASGMFLSTIAALKTPVHEDRAQMLDKLFPDVES